ncbi:MAG TPA: hypothetical protein VGL42_00705 [Opitutaceae bacterium]
MRAQNLNVAAWYRLNSGTAEDLNAVVAPPSGAYVAVGNDGTIVESPDGAVWTAEQPATAKNLYGVAVGTPSGGQSLLYVAVGENGTILTSPDGINWTAEMSGTSADLRAVAFGGASGGYTAVGQGGTAIVSPDGIRWSPLSLGTSADLNAVGTMPSYMLHFPLTIIGGAQGTLFVLNTSGAVSTGTTDELTVVLNDGTVLGSDGLIGGVSIPTDLPVTLWSSSSVGSADFTAGASTFPGDSWSDIVVDANGTISRFLHPGSQAISYGQLPPTSTYHGVAIGTATIIVGTGGAIWSNAGSAGGPPPIAGLSPGGVQFFGQDLALSVPTTAGAAYQWYLNGLPIAGATGSNLQLLNLQSTAAGTYSVAVIAANSSLESAATVNVLPWADFSPHLIDPSFVNAGTQDPVSAQVLSNGDILVNGSELLEPSGNVIAEENLSSVSQVVVLPGGQWVDEGYEEANPVRVRFNADGSVDQGFSVPPSVSPTYTDHLALLPNGQFVLFIVSIPNQTVRWVRLNGDGSIDATFAPQSEPMPMPAGQLVTAVDASGEVYVAVWQASDNMFETCSSSIFRLRSDLTVDPLFAVPSGTFSSAQVQQLQAVPSGLLYEASASGESRVGLLGWNGVPASNYTVAEDVEDNSFVLQPDGSAILLHGTMDSVVSQHEYDLERLTPSGQIDPNYGGKLVGDPEGAGGGPLSQLAVQPNGQLIIGGEFRQVNLFATPFLARISPDTSFAMTHLVNASARGLVSQMNPMTLGGYLAGGAITGPPSAPFLFRGVGPALAAYDVPDALVAPELSVTLGKTPSGTNQGWSTGSSAAEVMDLTSQVGAFDLPQGSADCALVGQAAAGPFYVEINALSGAGVALAEAYNAGRAPETAADLRVVNFSCLDETVPGSGQLTLGFVVAGPDVRKYLIRAVGPGLKSFLPNASLLAQPVLTLFQGSSALASNQNIAVNGDSRSVYLAGNQVGAFALPSGSADSALLVDLPAGAYTALATGANGTSGTVLLEVYEVP